MSLKSLDKQYLKGQVLVATPSMTDPRFHRTVIYVCTHNDQGAMGLVLNRLFGSITFADLLGQVGIKVKEGLPDHKVHFGGPMEAGRGFVLHSTDYMKDGTMVVDEDIALTGTVDILQAIANGEGPKKHLLCLGYAAWAAGQLEEEFEANSWISVPATPELVFDVEIALKWERALQKIGADPSSLSDDAGHA